MRYHIPDGVTKIRIDHHWCLTTPQGGMVAVDERVISLWEGANGRSLDQIIALISKKGRDEFVIRAALACFAEAGLLIRDGYQDEVFSPTKKVGKLVSVVIIAFNGTQWLSGLLPSIYLQNFSPIEIIVVDNGSVEPSGEWLASLYPDVHYQPIDHSTSLAAAINLGISISSGDYYLVLNQDIVLAPNMIAEMVTVAESDFNCAAVACKLLFLWAPKFINGMGNRVESSSWGTDNAIGWIDLGQFDHWKEIPSGCFAATLITRSSWSMVGPVDEGFMMYYEDAEWSYRARLQGWRIRLAPNAVAYHAFGGKIPNGKNASLTPFKLRNAVYGRLRFALKLVNDDLYIHYMMNYLREDVINFLHYLIRLNLRNAEAYISAWRKLFGDIHDVNKLRDQVMQRKIQNSEEVFHFMREFPQSKIWKGLPRVYWDDIKQDYLPMIRIEKTKPMPEFMDPNIKRRILVVSHDVITANMAGTGMRYLEMARAINRVPLDVTLAVPQETDIEIPGLRIVRYVEERPASLQVLVENNDVAVISGYMVQKFPFLSKTETSLVVDLYDPLVLENVHYYFNRPLSEQDALNQSAVEITNYLAQIGDFFICGNERQRDFWMGVLAANGRVNPHTIKTDTTLRSLLDIVGIGFPSRELHRQAYLKGIDPQFPQDCKIVLWGGGIWNWLDPLTLIKAWPTVVSKHPEARLVFLGTRHPNPQVPHHEMVDKAIQLAEEINEAGRTIRFIEWVGYADREALLSEADIGVTLHPITLETRYSLRTRVLDYIWARLPILVTQGDVTSEWVVENGIGKVVPEGNVEAVVLALTSLLESFKTDWYGAFEHMHEKFKWEQVVEPLWQYCLHPHHAPDRVDRNSKSILLKYPESKIHKAQVILKERGLGGLISRIIYHSFWLMTRHMNPPEQ